MQRGACAATAKLDGAVSSLAALDGAVPLLGLTDAATLYTLDPRVRRGVVHSLKLGARLRRLSTVDSKTCYREVCMRYPSVAYTATKLIVPCSRTPWCCRISNKASSRALFISEA